MHVHTHTHTLNPQAKTVLFSLLHNHGNTPVPWFSESISDKITTVLFAIAAGFITNAHT